MHPVPAILQFTVVFAVLATEAVNCCLAPVRTRAVGGVTDTATGGITVTVAVADFAVSAADVAVTNTCAGVGTVDGAVYRPVEDTTPQAAPLQPDPLTLQVTAVFVVFRTVAWNCCCDPAFTVAESGEMLTETGKVTVTEADPDLEGSATDVALTVTWARAGRVAGAV